MVFLPVNGLKIAYTRITTTNLTPISLSFNLVWKGENPNPVLKFKANSPLTDSPLIAASDARIDRYGLILALKCSVGISSGVLF